MSPPLGISCSLSLWPPPKNEKSPKKLKVKTNKIEEPSIKVDQDFVPTTALSSTSSKPWMFFSSHKHHKHPSTETGRKDKGWKVAHSKLARLKCTVCDKKVTLVQFSWHHSWFCQATSDVGDPTVISLTRVRFQGGTRVWPRRRGNPLWRIVWMWRGVRMSREVALLGMSVSKGRQNCFQHAKDIENGVNGAHAVQGSARTLVNNFPFPSLCGTPPFPPTNATSLKNDAPLICPIPGLFLKTGASRTSRCYTANELIMGTDSSKHTRGVNSKPSNSPQSKEEFTWRKRAGVSYCCCL